MLEWTRSRLLGGLIGASIALSTTATLAGPKGENAANGETSETTRDELFVIERTKNSNYIRFEANLGKDGSLVEKEPVISYWVMAAESGQREKVKWIEKKAFGFNIKKTAGTTDEYQMVLRAYKGQTIAIRRQDGKWRAALRIDAKPAYLTKLFIATTGNAPIPHVDHVDITGKDAVTNQALHERIEIR